MCTRRRCAQVRTSLLDHQKHAPLVLDITLRVLHDGAQLLSATADASDPRAAHLWDFLASAIAAPAHPAAPPTPPAASAASPTPPGETAHGHAAAAHNPASGAHGQTGAAHGQAGVAQGLGAGGGVSTHGGGAGAQAGGGVPGGVSFRQQLVQRALHTLAAEGVTAHTLCHVRAYALLLCGTLAPTVHETRVRLAVALSARTALLP